MTDSQQLPTQTSIWVTFQRHGIHRYPDAPERVQYLRDPHRHLFCFKVRIQVFTDDREIEFHLFQDFLSSQYATGVLQMNHKSCEMLARELLQVIVNTYPGRFVDVDVSEDRECGATVSYNPHA